MECFNNLVLSIAQTLQPKPILVVSEPSIGDCVWQSIEEYTKYPEVILKVG